jgi:MFS family permease
MVSAAVALLLALSWGRARYGWASPQIFSLIAGSAVLWALFALRLTRAPEPFIPLTMLREPVVFGIVVAGFFSIGTIIGLSIFFPLYVELVLGGSPSASGLVLIAFMCGATFGSMVAGRLLSRLDRYKRVPLIGLPIGIAALAALALWPGQVSLVEVSLLLLIGGAGLGPMYPTTTLIIQNAVPLHQLGIATGTLNFFRQLGGAIIVAVFAAIVLGGIEAEGLTLDTLAGAGARPELFAGLFRTVFVAAAMFLSVAFVALIAIEERPLYGPERHVMRAPSAPPLVPAQAGTQTQARDSGFPLARE